MTKSNSRSSNRIALHFISKTNGSNDRSNIKRVHSQALNLLEKKYEEDDIMDVIDYIVDVKGVEMYSFGYVSASIHNILPEVKKIRAKEIVKNMKRETSREEVTETNESKERNRSKQERFGVQSRIREKYSKHLFEGDGEDS